MLLLNGVCLEYRMFVDSPADMSATRLRKRVHAMYKEYIPVLVLAPIFELVKRSRKESYAAA